MKAAARIALIAAIIAAAGILFTAVHVISASSRSLLNMELQTAADDFRAYYVQAAEIPAEEYLDEGSKADLVLWRYLLASVPGASEFAVQIGADVVFNNTGFDARSFLQQYGQPYSENPSIVFGLADTAAGPRLVLGADLPAGSSPASVCLVRDISDTTAEIRNLIAQSASACSAGLIATMLAIFLSVRRMLRPLGQIANALSALAQGIYTVRVHAPGHDEFARLAADCNHTAEAIGGKVRALDQLAEDRQFLLEALAHEIRTPITAISAYAQTLQTLPLDDLHKTDALAALERQSRRLERLSSKMTQLVAVNRRAPAFGTVQAEQLARDLTEVLTVTAAAPALHIEVSSAASYTGDADLLRALLVNLVQNSVRAGAEHIEVSLQDDSLRVSDDGCGIAPEHLPHVLEPFYQAETSRSGEGFGLGLALAARIAALHQAQLTVQSKPGVGTQISLSFGSLHGADDSRSREV